MPRSEDDSPRRRRGKERYRSHDSSRSSSRGRRNSRDRDRHRRHDSHSKRRSISADRKKSYEPSPTSYRSTSSHRSKHRSSSHHRSRSDHKKSRHRRHRSSSSSSSKSSSVSPSRSKSLSRKRTSSPEVVIINPPLKTINLESSTNEEKRRQLIEEIDAESFAPRAFTSAKKVSDKVIIDLQKETISVTKMEQTAPTEDEIIHPQATMKTGWKNGSGSYSFIGKSISTNSPPCVS